jgi:carbamoyl-phosphate synthase large subunit
MNAVTGKTYACFEPTLDYVVVKIPKWPFDKFVKAKRTLGTQMKATGEVMSISSSFEAAFMKAIRSLELGLFTLEQDLFKNLDDSAIKEKLKDINDERIFIVAEALRRSVCVEEICNITKIDEFFVCKVKELVMMEEKLKTCTLKDLTAELLWKAKKMGFTDAIIARFAGCTKKEVSDKRKEMGICATYKMVDTCARSLML